MSELGNMSLLFGLFLFQLVFSKQVQTPNSATVPSSIWSNSAGVFYNDSYLMCNGRLGGAVRGGVASEILSMNEDSFWSGGFVDRVNLDALQCMPEMQSLIRQGRTLEAGRLAGFAYVGTPVSTRQYEALGDLELYMNHSSSASNYERYLDLNDATAGVYYVHSGVAYFREYDASNPANIVAVRLQANVSGTISFQVHLRRNLGSFLNRYEDFSKKISNDSLTIGGHSPSASGIGFAAGARVIGQGGKVYTIGDTILCDNADEAWIYFTAWTAYRKSDPGAAVVSDLSGVQPYEQVRAAHVADYQKYARRVSLSFGHLTDSQKAMTTAQRISNLRNAFDPELVRLYFQFGRYLLVSSSREGTLPPNLQGIWSADRDPGWGSKYTTNINIQMNYWLSLVTNLADLTSPLNDLIQAVQEKGSDVATKMYGAKGFACHHNTDMWGDAAPQDNFISSTWWPTAGPWLTFHLMEYYRYTGDNAFLSKYYPTLKAAATFFMDFLTDYKEWKVTNPSMSPENEYYLPNSTDTAAITLGPTIDNSLLRELFGELVEVKEILGLENETEFSSEVAKLSTKLPPLRVNSNGGIMEWIEDYQEAIPGIDHLSPLWGAYPGPEITSANNEMFQAAKITLQRRLANGGASSGWGAAWCASLSTRFFDRNTTSYCLIHLLSNQTLGTSLLNRGAPATFQIDGNFGGGAALAEMLVQSHESVSSNMTEISKLVAVSTGTLEKVLVIRLLPTLPAQFLGGEGYVKGLLARGGFVVDVHWDAGGELVSARVESRRGGRVFVTVGDTVIGLDGERKVKVVGGDGVGATFFKIDTRMGESYNIGLA